MPSRPFQIRLLGSVLASVLVVCATATTRAQGSKCEGCEPVKALEKKFKAWKGDIEDEGTYDLIAKASAAIKKLPTKKNKLSGEQVKQVTLLLKAAMPFDNAYAIIDNNFPLFQGNAKSFFDEFKKQPAKDAEALSTALSVKLGEAEEGQDEPENEKTPGMSSPETSPNTPPSKKPSQTK